ncbi:type IV pilus assembly protein PilY1 [Alteromonadaceae bacterium 2753L.S.0a.02]|nr:type IV pilus assembly protein PilY1 [Alteromonadaceae bacterium 2753L.S.0a.02]
MKFHYPRFAQALALSSMLVTPFSLVKADDTDIYLNTSVAGSAPYLMFMMDYRSDLSATYCSANGGSSCPNVLAEHPDLLAAVESVAGVGNKATNMQALAAVLKTVFDKFNGIYVGLMIPNNTDGGTILRGYELFEDNDTNGAKADLINIINSIPLPSQGNDYHETSPKETHMEWYRYVNGLSVINGKSTNQNFQGTSTPDYDSSIISGNSYNSPFATNPSNWECTNLYEVYATSGNTGGSDGDLDSLISTTMGGATSYEEMVGYLSNNDVLTNVPGDQTLKTWYIQMGSAATFTDDWAIAAGTDDQYMNVGGNSASLFDVQTKLEAAFVEALSVSTTFVAASIPVNVFNRIQILDDFYIALFEANATARWNGNLKKLKLHDSDADGLPDQIVDALGAEAFSNEDGRIKYEALTFWTDSAALPPADPTENEVTDRDGRSVNRGGAGQNIPGYNGGSIGVASSSTTRKLYLEPIIGTTLESFDISDALAISTLTELGAASTTEAKKIIAWARGMDIDDDDGDGDRAEARSWILGDAIHSRPLTINYGATSGYSETNPNIRLFMGTNDGVFHVFENTTSGGAQSGKELFGFIPREVLPNFKLLRENTTTDHLYGVDGEPVAFVNDVDADGTIESGETVYVYFAMRRGGKSIYALDASNPSADPSFKWKITKTSGASFDELGYTFSTPRVAKVRYGGNTVDALIFAGGYDTNKDSTLTDADGNRGTDTEGNAIYIVNADTGALIWKAKYGTTSGAVSNTRYNHSSMRYSIPSSITTLDGNGNGVIDRAYVGDLGGQVWRIDLPEGNDASDTNFRRDNWEVSVLARLADSAESTDMRFFHAPDVVQTRDSNGYYDAVIIASGDRANPLETVDQNHLFLVKDKNVVSGNPNSSSVSASQLTDVTSCSTTCSALTYDYGWKLRLTETGEKGLSSPLVSSGAIFFTSYTPYASGGSSCAPREGNGNLYILNLADGSESYSNSRQMDVGPGIPASPIPLNGDMILLPGTGIPDLPADAPFTGNENLLQVGDRSMWLLYWHESGTDSL